MARLQPNSRTVELLVRRSLDSKAQAQAAARAHRGFVAEAEAINKQVFGRVPGSETFVDGRKGAPLESVKLNGGVMLTRFDAINDIIDDIWRMLLDHSPVLTGSYRDSHRLFADGVEVDPGQPHAEAKEFLFVSTLPYARKVERWYSGQDGVYEGVATLAKGRFGNLATIRFTFEGVQETALMPYPGVGASAARAKNGRFTSSGRDRSAQKLAKSLRYPAIRITMR